MPKRRITSLGRKWELSNSLWMIWIFFPFGFTNWISFFYIGSRVKHLKWRVFGIIYLLITIQYFFVSNRYEIDEWQFDIAFTIALFGWIMSIIHAINARREYLRRLENEYYGNSNLNLQGTHLRKRAQQDIPSAAQISHPELERTSSRTEPQSRSIQSETVNPVDVNKATVEQLAAIPSIGMLLAAKIVEVRAEKGEFSSLDDFVQQLNLKPHIIVKAMPYLIFPEQQRTDEKKRTETVQGRIVDY